MTRIQNAAIGLAAVVCTTTFLTIATPVSAGQGKAKGHAKHGEKNEDKAEKKENKAAAKARRSADDPGPRFPGVDRDHDGVIRRAEWRGSDSSFANRDWNHDGVLSGDEMKPGAVRPTLRRSASSRTTVAAPPPAPAATAPPIRRSAGADPDAPVFARLDTNHDGVLTRAEWPDARFSSVDFNRDGVLSAYEYGVGR
jgi:hypothetical protein